MTIINLIFSPGRGTCDTASREAAQGAPYGALPAAHRAGYLFLGWFTAPEGDATAEKVVPSDTVSADEDVTLYAHYQKSGAPKKKSSLRTQRAFAIGLAAAIVVLSLVLVLVNYIVSIIPYTDPADGAAYTARRADGVYAVFDEAGNKLPQNEDGLFLTPAGTQLSVDPDTGKITAYAVVDVEGLEQVGGNSRILMFPQIRQSDIAKIEVTNAHGSFTFYVDEDGQVQILGFETGKILISYDQEAYAYLCAGAGNPLTVRKLDTAEVLKRGYGEYGLVAEQRTDAEGNPYDYTPARYTVTSKTGVSHTVLIGDAIVSGAGYYVKLEGEDYPAVYIMSNSIYDKGLMCRVEDLITPMMTYPTTDSDYVYVENFIISSTGENTADRKIEVAFDTIDLPARENSMFVSEPYQSIYGGGYQFSDYRLDDMAIGTVLSSLHTPSFVRVVKLGMDDETMLACGLDAPAYVIDYNFMVREKDEDGNIVSAPFRNLLFVSKRTDQGTYYVASEACDVIVEVHEKSLNFLQNSAIDWVDPNPFWINIAFLRKVTLTSPHYSTVLTLDNSKTDQSKSINSANLTFTVDGVTPDYVVYKTATSGALTPETPVYNLRQFYKSLLALTIAGEANTGKIALTEEEMAALRAQDDSACQLVLTVEAEDMAATYNSTYYKENNKSTLVYRFYRYSEGRSYMTINGQGEFFVDASFVEKLIADAERLKVGTLIDPTAKT